MKLSQDCSKCTGSAIPTCVSVSREDRERRLSKVRGVTAFQVLAQLTGKHSDSNDVGKTDVHAAITYILQRLDRRIDIPQMASTLALSRRTLERRFQECLGISVARAITLVRLKQAKHLLAVSEMSVTEISLAAGFSSPARMVNVFQRELGLSPRAFRMQTRDDGAVSHGIDAAADSGALSARKGMEQLTATPEFDAGSEVSGSGRDDNRRHT